MNEPNTSLTGRNHCGSRGVARGPGSSQGSHLPPPPPSQSPQFPALSSFLILSACLPLVPGVAWRCRDGGAVRMGPPTTAADGRGNLLTQMS